MNIFVVDLESVPTRYTCEWKDHVPALLRRYAEKQGLDVNIINISGGDTQIEATPGAFLNFQQTNIYKNNQLNQIAEMFTSVVKPGDRFLFTDFWNTSILQLKYMSELLGIPVEIHTLVHAGSYDPNDFLGRLIGNVRWTNCTEKAMFHAADYNWFATRYHIEMFQDNVFGRDLILWELSDDEIATKFPQTGWPMEYMPEVLSKYKGTPKEDIILFPHRVAPEKQPEIFLDLAESMPEYQFIICQDLKLSKSEYHALLAKSKVLFSANLQETLGISPYEGVLLNVRPYLPSRLSYVEMYPSNYMYPTEWTEDMDSYLENKSKIMNDLRWLMSQEHDTQALADDLSLNFFNAANLVKVLLRPN